MTIRPYERSLTRLHPRHSTLYINRGRTVLATGTDGFIADGPDLGLFVHQTRLLSRYRYLVNGRPFDPIAISPVAPHSSLGYYIAPLPGFEIGPSDTGSGQVPPASQQTLELRLARVIGSGFREEIALTNFTRQPATFRLTLDLAWDFADSEETRGPRRQKGRLSRRWQKVSGAEWNLLVDYRARHRYNVQGNHGKAALWRGFKLRVWPDAGVPALQKSQISIPVTLRPQKTWRMRVELLPHLEGKAVPFRYDAAPDQEDGADRKLGEFLDSTPSFLVPGTAALGPIVHQALERAKYDLASLRLFDLDVDNGWTMAAGLPVYVALFGRDTLTAGWQAALLGPDMMRGALTQLAKTQGVEKNDWRDEEPGRMLHEAHSGPLAKLNFTPREKSYGAVTTSAFYPVIVSELWHWTGDKRAVLPFVKPALDALHWLDARSRNPDGFYQYRTRSTLGTKHQGWKDSQDAIVDEDGAQVEPPIATCEEQAFVYIAKLQFAEVLWWLGRKGLAKKLHHEAAELKKRFNEAFWIETEGFLAMGLDSRKRQIKSIGSNAGHCVAAGIVDKSRVRTIVDRLFAPDLFSGWGVRTLSSGNPAYNPYSYHRGSVWPVEQGTFALGFMRYGLFGRLHDISRAQFELASLFDYGRLPELVSGHPRDREHPFPGFYPNLNWPQAWSSSAVFSMLQALLGLYPYAPLHMLVVDPHLPAWFPDITISDLRVGNARVTIHFWRTKSGASDYRVLRLVGKLHVVRQPSPWSLNADLGERFKDALVSFLPGK